MTPAGTDPMIELLREVREIRDEMRAIRSFLGLAAEGRLGASEFVRAVCAAVGEYAFTAVDLVDHCQLEEAGELRAAIVAHVGSLAPRRIGKALQALEGHEITEVVLRRVKEGRDGIEWQLLRVTRV